MSVATPGNKVRILILTAGPRDLVPVVQFLTKRHYDVVLNNSLREGVNLITRLRPDWVFISVNLSPTVEKYIKLLKQSFNVDPILFGDVLDRSSLLRLDQHEGRAVTAKLTGPSIQLKLSQILTESDQASGARYRMPPRATSGVRKDSFSHVHLKGENKAVSDPGVVQRAPGAIPSTGSVSHRPGQINSSLPVLQQLLGTGDDMPPPATRLGEHIQQVMVQVQTTANASGYKVMDGSENAAMEALKKSVKDPVLGPFKVGSEEFPKWRELQARLKKETVAGVGETLTCFVPAAEPLPPYKPAPLDSGKLEVNLKDLPVEVPLPCAFYVYLVQNQKFVCLIKRDGNLSGVQQDRLLKAGLKVLYIDKQDVPLFNYFYVREKLNTGIPV